MRANNWTAVTNCCLVLVGKRFYLLESFFHDLWAIVGVNEILPSGQHLVAESGAFRVHHPVVDKCVAVAIRVDVMLVRTHCHSQVIL